MAKQPLRNDDLGFDIVSKRTVDSDTECGGMNYGE